MHDGLSHPRAKARQCALEFLASAGGQEIPDDVMTLLRDPSSFVRQALLTMLSDRPDRYASELVQLSEDTWSRHSVPEGEVQNYPIARAAAKALSALQKVPPDLIGPIIEAAIETDDLTVTETLFTLLTERGDDDALAEVVNQVFTSKPHWASLEAAEALARTQRSFLKVHSPERTLDGS